MMRFPALLMVSALPLGFAGGALADGSALDGSASESAAAASAAEAPSETDDGTSLAKADDAAADGEDASASASGGEASSGEGSGGDADAGGPVAETPSDGSAKPAADGTVSGEVKDDGKGKKAKKAKKDAKDGEEEEAEAGGVAALAAGGVVGGGSSFPLGVTVSVTNAVGTGTFGFGYANNPDLETSLTLRPNFRVPQFFDYQPNMIVSGSLTTQISWLNSFTGVAFYGPRDRQLRISDGAVSLILPGLVNIPWIDVGITPVLTARIPLSISSRFANRLLGGSIGGQASYAYSWLAGTMGIQGSGGATAWSFLNTANTIPCGQSFPTGGGFFAGTGVADAQTELPLAIGRLEEQQADGSCILAGRQIVGTAAAALSPFWVLPELFGSHTLSGSASLTAAVLRPILARPELQSDYAKTGVDVFGLSVDANYFTSFSLAYTYGVPGDWMPFNANTQITAGVSSFQLLFYNGTTTPRYPFDPSFLWGQGGNNSTQAFLSLTVGI